MSELGARPHLREGREEGGERWPGSAPQRGRREPAVPKAKCAADRAAPRPPQPGPPLLVPGKPAEGAGPGVGADGRPSQRPSRLPLIAFPLPELSHGVWRFPYLPPLGGGGGGGATPAPGHPLSLELPPPHSWDPAPAPASLTRKGQHRGDPDTSREGGQAMNPASRRALVL